ncbi:hypothetical protein G7Y79_00003g011080 [Physcia stellaris]|nr:hypothetical protein G7Y79_00003g011080 [Physcia stellaris]
MEQEREDRDSAENDDSPMDLLDTPAKEATNVLRKLYAESTPLDDMAIDASGARRQQIENLIDPSEVQYQEDMDVFYSPNSVNGMRDNTLTRPLKSGLDQYQKHIYTPRSTRSMTKPTGSSHAEPEFEDRPVTEAAFSAEESDVPQIQAFAKLEFDDGEFYMNTYSVELGRDLQSARQAVDKTSTPAKRGRPRRRKRSASSGDTSHIPRKLKREHNRSHPSSVVSERGGIIAVDHSDAESLGGYYSKKPASTSSSSQQMSRKSSMLFAPHHTDYQSLAMASLMGPDALRHDDSSNPPLPAPEACPLIPIHPPATLPTSIDDLAAASDGADNSGSTVGKHKAISRKHVKIAFNFEKHLFEVHVFGRNGAYVDEEYCPCGDVRPLTNGSSLQIGNVSVKFLLPEVALGETGAERNAISRGLSATLDSEDRSSLDSDRKVHRNNEQASEDEDDSDTGKTSAQTSPEQKVPSKAKVKEQATKVGNSTKKGSKAEEPAPAPKRKGPGRPPKNGVMSKREMGLIAKQAREEAKAGKKEVDGEPAPGKGKSGKISNDKPPEVPSIQPNGKRKYTKRKNKVDPSQEAQETRESTEHTDSVAPEQIVPPKPPKEKKLPKPPRSPSPFIDRNSLTEEQLAKPAQSYVVLIHEALSESEKGPMSLNQIYRAIAHKYPYFKFVVTTVGWQSSIRHNLLQHEAFEKIEREGKGWMWGLKPGISIEKERKRRPTPPPSQSHAYYPPAHMMQQQYGYYPGMPPPPNGQPPYHPQYGSPAQGIPPHGLPQQYPVYPQGYYPPPPRPGGLPLPLLNAAADNSNTYQSPYESKAPTAPTQPEQPATQQQSLSQQLTTNGQPNSHPAESPYAPTAPPNPQPNQRPPQFQAHQTPATPFLSPLNMTSESRQAVDKFKDVLMSSMPDKAFGELLITSAINRVFGSQQHSSLPNRSTGAAEHPQEVMVMNALRTMIPSVVPKNPSSEAQRRDEGKDGEKANHEQRLGSGSLTPGGIAKGLIDDEGAIRGSTEAEVKEETLDASAAPGTPAKTESRKAEDRDDHPASAVVTPDKHEADTVDVDEPAIPATLDGVHAANSNSGADPGLT